MTVADTGTSCISLKVKPYTYHYLKELLLPSMTNPKKVHAQFDIFSPIFLCQARELGVDMAPQDWKILLEVDQTGGRPLPSPSPTSQSEVSKRARERKLLCFSTARSTHRSIIQLIRTGSLFRKQCFVLGTI